MQKLFYLYLSVSLSASVLIGVLFVCRPLWRSRFSKSWQYYIWLLAVVRLLIPFSPVPGIIGHAAEAGTVLMEEGITGLELVRMTEGAKESGGLAEADMNLASGRLEGEGIDGTVTDAWIRDSEGTFIKKIGEGGSGGSYSILSFAWLLWLLPALWIFGGKAAAYHRYVRRLKSVWIPTDNPEASRICRRLEEELKIQREIPVYCCKAAVSPMLAGIWRPAVLLPEIDFSSSELEAIFRHELIHYKRKDMVYKWLIEAAAAIHWFNPLVRLMRRECSRACELSCDETVIRGLSKEQRMAYGDTLIFSLKGTAGAAAHTASIPLCESNQILKERLEALMKVQKTTKLQKITAFLVTTCLAASLFLLGSFTVSAQEQKKAEKTELAWDYWLNDSGNPESRKWRHSFKTEGFFANKYGIRIAWNNDPALYKTTRQVTAEDEYTVAFADEMAQYADNREVLEAIRLAILEEREKEKNSNSRWVTEFIMTQPVVVGVDGPYEETYDELAVKFYQKNNLNYYSSVMKKASHETQLILIERSYNELNIPYFSLTEKVLTAEERRQYLERAYNDEEIACYSILVDGNDSETVLALANRAYEDDRIDFFSVTVSDLDESQCSQLAERARRDGKTHYLYVIPGAKQSD